MTICPPLTCRSACGKRNVVWRDVTGRFHCGIGFPPAAVSRYDSGMSIVPINRLPPQQKPLHLHVMREVPRVEIVADEDAEEHVAEVDQ